MRADAPEAHMNKVAAIRFVIGTIICAAVFDLAQSTAFILIRDAGIARLFATIIVVAFLIEFLRKKTN
jgi:hypothetical protein